MSSQEIILVLDVVVTLVVAGAAVVLVWTRR